MKIYNQEETELKAEVMPLLIRRGVVVSNNSTFHWDNCIKTMKKDRKIHFTDQCWVLFKCLYIHIYACMREGIRRISTSSSDLKFRKNIQDVICKT